MKRLDRLEIATPDLEDAAKIWHQNFGFEVRKSSDGSVATISIGGAEVQFKSSAKAEPSTEGMAALWLEADDVERVVIALKKAGLTPAPIRREANRRVLAIDPKVANQVPLFIFDRKA